jgi:DNA-binding NarL/FixJ family response regulator
MNERLAVALVSASPLVRAGLRAGLAARGDFEVTAEADDLDAWRSASPRSEAQVLIVEADDAGALAGWPDTATPALLLLLAPSAYEAIAAALRRGASVVDARSPIATIAAAAMAAASGLLVLTREHAAAIESAAASTSDRAEASDLLEPLTPRERQVLAQMSLGLANREIAQALHISSHTAKFHVAQILAKLDAATRAHAVAKAMRHGLMTMPEPAKEDALGIS